MANLRDPDFSGTLSYHVQQEKPDGNTWTGRVLRYPATSSACL